MEREYILDGLRADSLEAFFEEFSRIALDGARWGRNLDAFNDVLRGGFGTPDEGFTLRWVNSKASKDLLGYPETVRQLQLRLERCHLDNRGYVAADLSNARKGIGPTVFDWLVEIISVHGTGGEEADDNVRLLLE
ncbi:MAG: barnase inhibitor [Sphingomonas bacterium]|uniref:barstar family protein n=1 Tax=Sphingomonas bacterium TaxID=1895847 RepID=UPI00261070B6|nr:barstar family protein [Sphingomonas bacterium]MDB5707616.1 barnase inhibitor [Sphingomonas bacterium]